MIFKECNCEKRCKCETQKIKVWNIGENVENVINGSAN
jgi:hypothetical protein